MGYIANANEQDSTSYEGTVKNFGTSSIAGSNAFAQLAESNQYLGLNLASNVTDLQNQIQNVTQLVHIMEAATTRQSPMFNHQPPQICNQPPPQH